ncbi:hypothetical protein PR048_031839 [Dryococelus australis]|uniref:Uncharacterized protein n=1 Tax=Dryococelus australis TaxID=614101 RepID=A0ABQ9G6E8_9NEOP|nr:hypothetical protein PR048_031839 [Dryococelus australis]
MYEEDFDGPHTAVHSGGVCKYTPFKLQQTDEDHQETLQRSPFVSPAKAPRGCKRVKTVKKLHSNKKRRNEGRPHTSSSGKSSPSSTVRKMCRCPLKCYDLQVKVNEKSVRVCKTSFMSIHGLRNHRGRVNNIISKLKAHVGTPTPDQHGRHQNHPNRCSGEAISGIHDHVKAIPKYRSHYSRFQNPNRVYLGSDMNIKTLYGCYIKFCSDNNKPVVSEDYYRKSFSEQYNIGFKFPATDTCKTCDSFQCFIDNGTEQEKTALCTAKELHLRYADSLKSKLKERRTLQKKTLLFIYMIQTKRFVEIKHYVLISSHTYLPSNRDFAKIEKCQTHHPNVYSPSQ